MTDTTNITANGPNSIAAAGNVEQTIIHNPKADPLQTAIEQRQIAYQSMLTFDQKRKKAWRGRWLNRWNFTLLALLLMFAAALYFIVWPSLSYFGPVYWLTHLHLVFESAQSIEGVLVFAPLILAFLCAPISGKRRIQSMNAAVYFSDKAHEMNDQCHRLDEVIKYHQSRRS